MIFPALNKKPCEQILTHSATQQHSNLYEQAPFAWENTHRRIVVCKNISMLIWHTKRKPVAVLCMIMNYSESKDKWEGDMKREMEWENHAREEWETQGWKERERQCWRSSLILIWQRRSFIETDSLFCLASHTSLSLSCSFALHLSPTFSFHPSVALSLF